MLPDRVLTSSAVGTWPERVTPVEAGGYTRSRTWQAETQDGSVFLKEASDEGSLSMLRREAMVYANVSGSFLPALVGFADDGDRALLALEYLSDVRWPPPYPDDVSPLFAALEQASATSPPSELPAHRKRQSRWERIAADPEPFLGLGVCSPIGSNSHSLRSPRPRARRTSRETRSCTTTSTAATSASEGTTRSSSTGEPPSAAPAGSTSHSHS